MSKPLFNFGPKTPITDNFTIDPQDEGIDPGVYYIDENQEGVYIKGENSAWFKRLTYEEIEENLDGK